MLSRKKKTTNADKKQTKDVVQINKYRRVGNIRIRLVSYNKGPWEISISNREQGYANLRMTKSEFKELLLEIKDMLGDL